MKSTMGYENQESTNIDGQKMRILFEDAKKSNKFMKAASITNPVIEKNSQLLKKLGY